MGQIVAGLDVLNSMRCSTSTCEHYKFTLVDRALTSYAKLADVVGAWEPVLGVIAGVAGGVAGSHTSSGRRPAGSEPVLGSAQVQKSYEYWAKLKADAGAKGGAVKGTVAIPESRVGHIFRKADGHLPDTPANRELLTNLANDGKAVLGSDRHGTTWSAKVLPDGSQAWVQTRGDQVINGGINKIPKPYDPERGLASLKPRGSKNGK